MAYVTVTTWEFPADIDEAALTGAIEKNLSGLKQMGAERGYSVRTSDTTGMVVMVYPEKTVWDRIRATVEKMREDAQPDMNSRLTGVLEGEAGVEV